MEKNPKGGSKRGKKSTRKVGRCPQNKVQISPWDLPPPAPPGSFRHPHPPSKLTQFPTQVCYYVSTSGHTVPWACSAISPKPSLPTPPPPLGQVRGSVLSCALLRSSSTSLQLCLHVCSLLCPPQMQAQSTFVDGLYTNALWQLSLQESSSSLSLPSGPHPHTSGCLL